MFDVLSTYLRVMLSRLHNDEEGQTAVEYALVIVGVSLFLCGLLVAAFGTDVFDTVATKISDALD